MRRERGKRRYASDPRLARTRLPVDRNPASDFLITAQGQAVRPVHTREEFESLSRTATLFASHLEEVRGHPAPAASQAEEVVALGPMVADAGRLYAHLTMRAFRMVEDLRSLRRGPRPAVVVTTPPSLTSGLLEFLYADALDGPAPGIICASGPQALRKQVLIRSAAASLCGPVAHPWVDVYPLVELDSLTFRDRRIYGGKASESDIPDALSKGAGVLTMITHSDGIDALILPTLSLCPLVQMPADADPQRSPTESRIIQ